MDTKIQEILNDLYKLDASLKDYEVQIIKIIDEYIKNKPDTKFDQAFADRLKSEILKRAVVLKKAVVKESPVKPSPFMFFAGKFTYALAGVAVVLLIVILPLATYFNKSNQLATKNSAGKLALDFNEGISKIADQAFGKLSGAGKQDTATMNSSLSLNRENSGMVSQDASVSKSSLAAESTGAVRQLSPAIGFGGGGGVAGSAGDLKMMPSFQTTSFEFIYKGDELKQERAQLPVMKRVKSSLAGSNLGRQLTGMDTGLIDLSKFSGAGVTNINLTEDKEFGYFINFDFQNGLISIYSNWQKWPRADANCRDDACYESFRIKYENVPSDEAIIQVAGQFLKDYSVNMDGYGEPFVLDYWRREYERLQGESMYIPEEMSVVYPLVINGETVYDESGNPTGLSVGVNIIQNKVSSVNVITPQTFQSSDYAATTDADKILKIAKQGGMYGYYQYGDAGKKVEVELGTPKLALMRYYLYNDNMQSSDELFVPAYVFPVANVSDTSVYFDRKNVVVPLVEDIIKDIAPIGIPEPMPFINSNENLKSNSDTTRPPALPGSGTVKPEDKTESNTVESGVEPM